MSRAFLFFLALSACSTTEPAALDLSEPQISDVEVRRIDPVTLKHTPVEVDREVTIRGGDFSGTAFGPWVHFGEIEAPSVRILDANTVVALVPSEVHGMTAVRVTNPDQAVAEVRVDLQ